MNGECELVVIGGGLSGAEAAWQAARAGVRVRLYEMRPAKQTPVHRTGLLSELVCSNSLKSDLLTSASGLLKEEMRILGSLVIECADANRLPAGQALAVDRDRYAECVTDHLTTLPEITLVHQEVTELPPEGVVIIASGPLTSDALAGEIARLTGRDYLYFYDAVAPTITADSIDCDIVYRASRYGKGDADYLNCPMSEDEYNAFYDALVSAERVPTSAVEPLKLFEGCLPVEEIASRGRQTLAFGPLKPVGLEVPFLEGEAPSEPADALTTPVVRAGPRRQESSGHQAQHQGTRPYAVVQLRQENREGTLWGLVGFQTRLKWPEQERIFRMIPGLQHAEFVRYGVMHRNTYIESPQLLDPTMMMRSGSSEPVRRVFFAGQITGVEGYVESAAMGMIAGINAARLIKGQEPAVFPRETMIGALADYITSPHTKDFQPMNANFGILPKPEQRIRNKRDRQAAQVERALQAVRRMMSEVQA